MNLTLNRATINIDPCTLTGTHPGIVPFGIEPAHVREWADEAGYDVGTRGRLPQVVIDDYIASHNFRIALVLEDA